MCYEFVKVHFIAGYVIVGGHDLIGDRFLAVDDGVENAVDGIAPEEVITGDVVFLADAVGSVLALAAVGVCPGKFNEGYA